MGIDPDVAGRLVAFFLPIMALWFFAGVAIAVLYHLSLYYLEGEFRTRGHQSLDLLIAILRSIAFVVAWPWIFILDRSALSRIRLFLLYLNPKQREQNEDLRDALAEREYWRWLRSSFVEEERAEHRRKKEFETGEERKRRLKVLHEGNPGLDRIWLLAGAGANPAGVQKLVRLYPEYYNADDIAARAREEVKRRRPWSCLRCSAVVAARDVVLPELFFLRVVEPGQEKMVFEGWALDGEFRMTFPPCPKCGAEQPGLTEEVCRFGRASDVARLAREGLSLHWDLP